MVLQKRLDYGFKGYQVPYFPRASRSVRRRSFVKRKADDKQICAFELLATVAGDLLQDRKNSESPSDIADTKNHPFVVKDVVRQEEQAEEKPLELCNPESCDKRFFVSDFSFEGHNHNKNLKELQHSKRGMDVEHSSVVSNLSCLEKCDHAAVVTGQRSHEFVNLLNRTDRESPCCREASARGASANVVDGIERPLECENDKIITSLVNGTLPYTCSSEHTMELDITCSTLVGSNSSAEIPLPSFLQLQTNEKLVCNDDDEKLVFRDDDEKLVCKDDEENSSRRTHPSIKNWKTCRSSQRIGHRRIRRLFTSKYWKVASTLNDRKLSRNEMRHVYRNTRPCYAHQRPRRNSVFKRRKLFEKRSVSRSEELTHCGARRASLVAAQESSCCSRDSHLKLSIKSFRVPELFIEIPETATVGSLKKTVTEAVTTILAGGLCVGMVLHGKKVGDDNKTLLQTGISHEDKLDALGFMLEPSPSLAPDPVPVPQPFYREDPPLLVSYAKKYPQPARYSKIPDGDHVPSAVSPNPGMIIDVGRNAVPSAADMKVEKSVLDSQALISNPKNLESLTAVPSRRRTRQTELAPRRIRRPFTVSEVEVLVAAVEKLGTGRWRDVKVHAFEAAKHRTYVDLKDKWKTLVHTARIAPQQRRGEPVPQELLDRVLTAHGHWSQQAAAQQIKQQTEACLHLFNLVEDDTHEIRDN